MPFDNTFFFAFALLSFFVLGIGGMFIKKMLKDFKDEIAAATTAPEQLAVTVAFARTTEKSNRMVLLFVSTLFALAGIAALLAAFHQYNMTRAFLHGAEKTEGTIVRVEVQQTDSSGLRKNSSVAYYPRFTFVTHDGVTLEILSNTGVSDASYYQPGDAVEVLYNPGDPQGARINSFFQLWATALIFFAASVLFLLVPIGYGIYCFVRSRSTVDSLVGK